MDVKEGEFEHISNQNIGLKLEAQPSFWDISIYDDILKQKPLERESRDANSDLNHISKPICDFLVRCLYDYIIRARLTHNS